MNSDNCSPVSLGKDSKKKTNPSMREGRDKGKSNRHIIALFCLECHYKQQLWDGVVTTANVVYWIKCWGFKRDYWYISSSQPFYPIVAAEKQMINFYNIDYIDFCRYSKKYCKTLKQIVFTLLYIKIYTERIKCAGCLNAKHPYFVP